MIESSNCSSETIQRKKKKKTRSWGRNESRVGDLFIRGGKDVTSTWEGKDLPKGGSIRMQQARRGLAHIYIYIYIAIYRRSAGRPIGTCLESQRWFSSLRVHPLFRLLFFPQGVALNRLGIRPTFCLSLLSLLPCVLPPLSLSLSFPFSRPRNNNRREKEIKGALSTLFPSLT